VKRVSAVVEALSRALCPDTVERRSSQTIHFCNFHHLSWFIIFFNIKYIRSFAVSPNAVPPVDSDTKLFAWRAPVASSDLSSSSLTPNVHSTARQGQCERPQTCQHAFAAQCCSRQLAWSCFMFIVFRSLAPVSFWCLGIDFLVSCFGIEVRLILTWRSFNDWNLLRNSGRCYVLVWSGMSITTNRRFPLVCNYHCSPAQDADEDGDETWS